MYALLRRARSAVAGPRGGSAGARLDAAGRHCLPSLMTHLVSLSKMETLLAIRSVLFHTQINKSMLSFILGNRVPRCGPHNSMSTSCVSHSLTRKLRNIINKHKRQTSRKQEQNVQTVKPGLTPSHNLEMLERLVLHKTMNQ